MVQINQLIVITFSNIQMPRKIMMEIIKMKNKTE